MKGLVTSYRKLDNFLGMMSNADAAREFILETDNEEHVENVQLGSSGKKMNSKDNEAPKRPETDPELKMVLNEIHQELNQGESWNEGTKRSGPETTGWNSEKAMLRNANPIPQKRMKVTGC